MKNALIVYYSGTGNSAKVASCFELSLQAAGWGVSNVQLKAGSSFQADPCDLLLVIFAVHACNAPEAVYQWLDKTPRVSGTPAVVISVSGGGEIIPNTACRVSSIKRLEKKGYRVFYENMIVMPSNWIVATKEPLAVRLLEVLPLKVHHMVQEIVSGTKRRTRPLWIDRFFSLLGELEKVGARDFGKKIRVSGACNNCGWCSRNCPAGNITMGPEKPVFDKTCHLCLKCIYGCPVQALSPGTAQFVIIKEGFSLAALEKKVPYPVPVDVDVLARGILWSGVRKYLSEEP